MYSIINENIKIILSSIKRESHIEPYLYLINEPRETEGEIFKDTEYRKKYRKFWSMNSARLPSEFYDAYFDTLNSSYSNNINATEVALELYSILTDKKSFQFSFASKLVHMSNTNLPIYDSMISSFYHMPEITQNTLRGKQLQSELNYNFLLYEYNRILSSGILKSSILMFRNYFSIDEKYSDQKIIDSIIWGFISLSKRGAVIDQTIKYS
ncbi:hypothetical protein [Shewanella baltica]|uniref:hypothetical protein n=2 Tax=Shewanella TaxID=22 RepID=UPI0039B038CA